MGASINMAVGLPEMIVRSRQEYIKKATDLAHSFNRTAFENSIETQNLSELEALKDELSLVRHRLWRLRWEKLNNLFDLEAWVRYEERAFVEAISDHKKNNYLDININPDNSNDDSNSKDEL